MAKAKANYYLSSCEKWSEHIMSKYLPQATLGCVHAKALTFRPRKHYLNKLKHQISNFKLQHRMEDRPLPQDTLWNEIGVWCSVTINSHAHANKTFQDSRSKTTKNGTSMEPPKGHRRATSQPQSQRQWGLPNKDGSTTFSPEWPGIARM